MACLRCGGNRGLDEPLTALCCASVLDDAEINRPEDRRFSLWTLRLCGDCLSLALRDALVKERASAYELMQYAPGALIFGAASLWFIFFHTDPDPDNNFETFMMIMLAIVALGAIGFGMFFGPYATRTFRKLNSRLKLAVTSTSEQDRLDAYTQEAHRILDAMKDSGDASKKQETVFGDFPIPTVTAEGTPWSNIIAVGATDEDILSRAGSSDATYTPAVEQFLSESSGIRNG